MKSAELDTNRFRSGEKKRMSRHLNCFQWLVYGAIAVQAVETLLLQKSLAEFGEFGVIAIAVVALAWAAAREKSKYAAWLLVIFFIADTANTIGLFWGEGASWLQSVLAPDHPATDFVKAMDTITNLLEIAALYFYFFGDIHAVTQQH
jgi:hypothetical protein